MEFKIDKNTVTLVDRVETSILNYIKVNKLVPGDCIPNELELSKRLGVSRNVLREALSRLKMLGIIQSQTKKGIFIREPYLLAGFEKTLKPGLLSVNSIKNMMGLRITIEIGIADFLFINLTGKGIEELKNILQIQPKVSTYLEIQQELEFHRKIYELSGNTFISQLQQILLPVFQFAHENYEKYFAHVNEGLKRDGKTVTHIDLFNLIKERDVEGYRVAIKTHLQPYTTFVNGDGFP